MAADEGYVFEITATISGGQSVTWATSNSAIAEITRVESTSVEKARITAVKAGQATITATAANGDTATCTVYVLIDEGVYYLKNSDLCLAVDGSLLENTAMKMLAQCTAGPAKIRQLWKIKYIADGYYSIRTFYKQNMALHASGATVDITTIGDGNTLNSVPLASRWKIDKQDGGYLFKYTGSLGVCLRPNDTAAGAGAKVAAYVSGSQVFHWQLQRDTSVSNQVLLINTAYGLPATNAVRYVAPGETVTLAEMNLTASYVSLYATNQSITWHAADPTVVSVNRTTGAITGIVPDASTTIIARRVHNDKTYEKTFTIHVKYDYTVYVNHYYDIGYDVRFGTESETVASKITRYQEIALGKFLSIFDQGVVYTVSPFTSSLDECKIMQYGLVSSSNLTANCEHEEQHLSSESLRNDLADGSTTVVTTIWTGHIMPDNPGSTSHLSRYSIVMTPMATTFASQNYINRSDYEVEYQSVYTLMHELAHQFDAYDRYCNGIDPDTNVCTNENCDRCYLGIAEEIPCIMHGRRNIYELTDDQIFCDDCYEIIVAHLEDHHE